MVIVFGFLFVIIMVWAYTFICSPTSENDDKVIKSDMKIIMPHSYELSHSKTLKVGTINFLGSFQGWIITDGWEFRVEGKHYHTLKDVFITAITIIDDEIDAESYWISHLKLNRDDIPFELQKYVQ